ncbi:MAG: phenylalanine--tRNA ligase subunit beta [Oligoflexales bacterium]|nr:phenylalanine--tRNA ligase subunit beta [Oligoflexales bacterium]
MKISLNWINDYVNLKQYTPEQIAASLTDIGLEVESIKRTAKIDSKIVVAKIITAHPHPQADRLQICQVQTANNQQLDVVCGAKNARAGLFVALAQIDAELPNGTKIKAGKIRGVDSHGMLCSEAELGLSDASDGILELDADSPLGLPVEAALQNEDVIFELNITPNRGDCFGYIGVARDLAAKLKLPLVLPRFAAPTKKSLHTKDHLQIAIEANSGCSRFYCLLVKNIKPTPSPRWLRQRLENSGLRSINVIVDATNYTMLETGQPIHAYNLSNISGNKITVRSGKKVETLTTLDGLERKIENEDILICDGEKVVGLAGIMGGQNSEISATTENIVIEAAHFDAIQVRKTSKRLGIHSDASYRFERGTDLSQVHLNGQRVADILYKATAGTQHIEIAESGLDDYPQPYKPRLIAMRHERLCKIIGIKHLNAQAAEEILQSLGIKACDSKAGRTLYEVPSWRNDIEREIDLIEEVARIYGFEKIPYKLPKMNIAPNYEDSFLEFNEQLRIYLAQAGLAETVSFPFNDLEDYNKLRIDSTHPYWPSLKLKNPLNENASHLQTTLLPTLINSLVHNRHHQTLGSKLFLFGHGFYHHEIAQQRKINPILEHVQSHGRHLWETNDIPVAARPVERLLLAGVLDQPASKKSWLDNEKISDFFTLKSILSSIFKSYGLLEWDCIKIDERVIPFLHPNKAAFIEFNNSIVGYFGEVHPEVLLNFDLSIQAAPLIFELDVELFFNAQQKTKQKINNQAQRFPGVSRDFAFLVDRKTNHGQFVEAFKSFPDKQNLQTWKLFDLYQGEKLEGNKKSMGYSLLFESKDKTLTDNEVEKEVQKILAWLNKCLQAEIRQ